MPDFVCHASVEDHLLDLGELFSFINLLNSGCENLYRALVEYAEFMRQYRGFEPYQAMLTSDLMAKLNNMSRPSKHMTALFYSGGCRFCRWVARTILPLLDPEHTLIIMPFRQPIAWEWLKDLGLKEDQIPEHWWFLDLNGKLWAGNQGGGKQLLLTLPYTKWWVTVIPSKWFDWLDDWVKRNRPILSQWISDGPAILSIAGEVVWLEG